MPNTKGYNALFGCCIMAVIVRFNALFLIKKQDIYTLQTINNKQI